MCTSIKLVLLYTFLAIHFFGSVAFAFAMSPRLHQSSSHSSTGTPPGRKHPCVKSTFGTFNRQQFQSHHRYSDVKNNNYQNQRLPSVAMIPDSRSQHEQDDNNPSSRQPTVLDAKRMRGGGSETKQLIPKEETAIFKLTTMAQPVSNAMTSFADTIATSKKLQGRAILLLVALLYGTLNVTLRGIYATEGPPVASVLSLVRQVLSVIAFIPLFIFSKETNENEVNTRDVESGNGVSNSFSEVEKARPLWLAAVELAFWNFGAQGLINAGLLHSPAARAAFLTQTSVVMTPLISRFAGESIKNTVWGGCALALLGLFFISTAASDGSGLSSATDDAAMNVSFSQGDAMILLGALSWSTYIFRTSKIAKSYPELNLQAVKNALLALMYGVWFANNALSTLAEAGTSMFSPGWTEALSSLWSGWNSPFVWLLLIYSAIGPGTVADLLQQSGQKETSASESNIILCLESVFATLCAFLFLGEVSSIQEIFGGALIVFAAILASR